MRFLLRFSHWQLFLMTWGIPIIIEMFTFSDPQVLIKLFPILMLFFALGTFGWIWAIATSLSGLLPEGVRLNVTVFKVYFALPVIYSLAIISFIAYRFTFGWKENFNEGLIFGIVLPLHFASMICIILGMRFAAKMMRSVELGRIARFGDYAGEFFLIWFSIIGYWVLQPRLNRLSSDKSVSSKIKLE